jgi:hypothetical protein
MPHDKEVQSARKRHLAFVLALLAACGNCAAACFQANPMVPPSNDIGVYTGETPEGLMAFGKSPYGRTRAPYPPPPPAGIRKQDQKLSPGEAGTLTLWYFEANPKDRSLRVCRVDLWLPRQHLGQGQGMFEQIAQHAKGNALSRSLLEQDLTLAYEQIIQADLSKDLPVMAGRTYPFI